MNERQIEAFRQVMACGGVSAAARRMNVSQPSISRLITDLERTSGLTLFDRHRGKTSPREEAVSFYQEVEKVFCGLTHLSRAADEIRKMGKRLRVSCFPAAGHELLPDVVARFRRLQPGTGLALDIRTSNSVLDSVVAGTADFGLTTSAREHSAAQTVARFTAPCVCVLRASDPLAALPSIDLSQLDPASLIWVEPDLQISAALASRLTETDALRSSTIETNLALPACRMVANGLGVAVIDPLTARLHLGQGLTIRPTTPELPYQARIVMSRFIRRSKMTQGFLDILVAQCQHAFRHNSDE
jgi:DNA-binding transcriptional LysR family regulator